MTEGQVSELVNLVCFEEGIRAPSILFCETPHALFEGYHEPGDKTSQIGERIHIPAPDWTVEHDPDCIPEGRYLLTVLHELAHHIAWVRHGENGHTPFMYGKLFQLCVRHGVDLVFAYENETDYKPRAAKRGWNLFRRWALA